MKAVRTEGFSMEAARRDRAKRAAMTATILASANAVIVLLDEGQEVTVTDTQVINALIEQLDETQYAVLVVRDPEAFERNSVVFARFWNRAKIAEYRTLIATAKADFKAKGFVRVNTVAMPKWVLDQLSLIDGDMFAGEATLLISKAKAA